jgi:hypothetical protein
MKPKDILLLAIRLLGLVFLFYGLMILSDLVPVLFAGNILRGVLPILWMAGWRLYVARWLLGGAPLLLRIAYPSSEAVARNLIVTFSWWRPCIH